MREQYRRLAEYRKTRTGGEERKKSKSHEEAEAGTQGLQIQKFT